MSFQLQATVDICFKIKSFRNLTGTYLRSMYFKLSVNVGNNPGVPYQIISEKQNLSSITLLDYISPLVSFGPLAKTQLNELAIFRLNVPINEMEENNLTYKFTLVESSNGSNQRVVGELETQHSSLLWINSYSPIYFANNGCGIDITVQTQLLKFRAKQLTCCPKNLLTSAMELLLVSFNRLKNKLSQRIKNMFAEKIQLNLLTEFEQVSNHHSHGIFQPLQRKQARQKLLALAFKLIPQLGDCIQQSWSQYQRKQLLATSIEKQLDSYLNSFSLKVKQIGNQAQEINPQCIQSVIQNIIISQPIPFIKLVSKEQIDQTFQLKTSHHFVILVHGYGATSSVMVEFELLLRHLYPHLIVINSRINQSKTEDEIVNMGKRLASEVQMVISHINCGDDYNISFIAHSLGGLIARSALTFMQQQRYHMKCFISLGTPHLGHLYHNSTINKIGMWAFSAFKKSVVMSALLLQSQQGDYRKSYVYELSLMSGLNWFEEVIFYGSKGDKFVSLQSSLCLSYQDSFSQKHKPQSKAAIWEEMKANIQSHLKGISHSKYSIDFTEHNHKLNSSNFTDDWLGRRDHINLCMSQTFITSVLATHKHIFK